MSPRSAPRAPGDAPWVLAPYEDPLARVAGHTFVVPDGYRPTLRIEFANGFMDGSAAGGQRVFARVGRVTSGHRTAAWFAIEAYWERMALAQSSDSTPWAVLPPITARAAARPPASPHAPLLATLDALVASPHTPLHPGRWWIGSDTEWPFSRPWIDLPELTTRPATTTLDHFEWRLLPLRPFTGGRRVGFWQKQIAAGHLPPVVVLAVSVIEMFLVLDGHDRLEAAHREGVPCPLRILAPLRTQRWPEDAFDDRRAGVARQVDMVDWDTLKPLSQKKLNDAVVGAWARPEHTYPRSRCWPIAGGLAGWRTGLPPGAEALLDVLK